jgi:hypothetical protein
MIMNHILPKAFAAMIGLTVIMAGLSYMSHVQGWRIIECLSSVVGSILGGSLACAGMVFAVVVFISRMRSALVIRRVRNEQRARRDP